MSSNDSVVMAGAERAELQALRAELTALRTRIVADASVEAARWLVDADDRRAASVLNLLYYRQFRRIDLRGLQRRLSNQGLSSLGRSEAHLLHDLDRVLALLAGVLEGKWFAARATQGPDILAG